MADAGELRANRLLAMLPAESLEGVASGSTILQAKRGQIIYMPGEPMDQITFPLTGLFSLVITDVFGSFTSIATVGREGAIELAPALGAIPSPAEIVCLIGGRAAQVATHDLRDVLDNSPEFRAAVFRYLGARFVDCVEVSACHRLHPLEARMARYLLTVRDRIERDEFPCTHEQLAGMLGASRPKVSLALEALEQAGHLVQRRGAIEVLDPVGLEEMTCGCYRTIRDAFLAEMAAAH